MMKTFVGLVMVAVLAATAARAADMAAKAPPPPAITPAPAYSWTGFYIGANGGGGWGQNQSTTFSDATGPLVANIGIPASLSFHASGAIGGVQLGYNWQFNQAWLVGLETDFDFSDIDGSGTSNNVSPLFSQPLMSTANEKVEWFGTVRGRVGYLPTNNLLLYGTAGFAFGRVKQSVQYINNGAIAIPGNDGSCPAGSVCYAGASDRLASGWTVGAGFEYAFVSGWTFRAEYLFVDLGGNTFNENVLTPGFISATSSLTAHFNDAAFGVVRGGVNYKF